MKQSKHLNDLIDALTILPGVGKKSAQRMAYKLMRNNTEKTLNLSQKLLNVTSMVSNCKICGIYWKKKDWIFSENIPKKISCVDKTCFLKQGGLSKNVKIDMIHRISNINKIRNILSHPRKPDQEMLKKYLMEAYVTCDILNHYIEDELKNKQFA